MTLPEGAELGATKDPKALIKGEPATIQSTVDVVDDEITRVAGIYSRFKSVTVPSWSGEIGQPAYAAAHTAEGEKWTAYRDLLTTLRDSLTTYRSALVTAQDKAQDAIDKWEQGEQATERARTSYNAEVADYNRAVSQPQLSPIGGTGPRLIPAAPGPFSDPGAALRAEAAQILLDAREALDDAGATATKDLGGLPGAKTEGSTSGPSASGSAEGPSFSWDAWENTFGKDPTKGADGKYENGAGESPFKISLGKVEGQASVWGAKGSYEDYFGGVKVNADGSVTVLGVEGGAEASISGDGLVIGANGKVVVAGAEGSVSGEYGYAEGKLAGEAYVGAEAEGRVELGPTGAHATGEVFAGAKAEGTVSGDVGGVGGEGTAEGWAGIGASGHVEAGYDDGKITVGGSGGLAFGLGGKLGGSVTIDLPEVADTAGDVVDEIGSWLP